MNRPHLFVVGDSISMGYGPFLQAMIAPWLTYARKTGEEPLQGLRNPASANGGDSDAVLDYLQAWRQTGGLHADYLLLNCGLHDIKVQLGTETRQVPLERYRANLPQIIDVACTLGAQPIWMRTTPVNDEMHNRMREFYRYLADVEAYNAVADEIMRAYNVPVADLFSFTLTLGSDTWTDGVHFQEAVCIKQAAFIAGFLYAAAEKR